MCGIKFIRNGVFGQEALKILKACHEGPTGGHHSANITARKVFDPVSFGLPFIRMPDIDQVLVDASQRPRLNLSTRECPSMQSKFVKFSIVGFSSVSQQILEVFSCLFDLLSRSNFEASHPLCEFSLEEIHIHSTLSI
ncbi:hypothetical protein Tco_1337272 [Tanacetum coccineum]